MQRSNAHCASTANLKSLNANSEVQINSVLMKLLCMRQSMTDTAQSTGLDWTPKKTQEEPADSLDEMMLLTDDLEKLWRALMENVAIQRSQLFELKSYSRVNEEYLLYSYKTLVGLTESLSHFSKVINETNLPTELYKSFRKMYEMVSTLTTAMHKYRSLNVDFTDAKQIFISDQMNILETVHTDPNTNSKFSTVATEDESHKEFKLALDKMGPPRKQPCPGQRQSQEDERQRFDEAAYLQIDELKMEISRLEEMLQQNNDEFTVEIEKYNKILYQQQDQLKSCEQKFLRLQGKIEELESMNVRLREQKERDDMLIEYILKIFRNMSRKLRVYEKESGYLSPSRSRAEPRKQSREPSTKSRFQSNHQAAYPRMRSDFTHTYIN